MEKETTPENLSAEQLIELRDEQTKFMTDQLEHLEIQSKYTRLKSEIATNRLTEHMSKLKFAQLLAPSEKSTKSK
jgi:hypothetical protein|tara:strand:- start:37069 stop:37293 length:225 start_codon:yes stop_codon:yes gene_type:complete